MLSADMLKPYKKEVLEAIDYYKLTYADNETDRRLMDNESLSHLPALRRAIESKQDLNDTQTMFLSFLIDEYGTFLRLQLGRLDPAERKKKNAWMNEEGIKETIKLLNILMNQL
jgi:hypothetical protein